MLDADDKHPAPVLVHAPRGPSPALRELAFLVGHLRGEGWLGAPARPFGKQVWGRWVAGNQHLLLEMQVDYPQSTAKLKTGKMGRKPFSARFRNPNSRMLSFFP